MYDERPFDYPGSLETPVDAPVCQQCNQQDAAVEFRGMDLCPDCYELSFEADCDAQEEARLND